MRTHALLAAILLIALPSAAAPQAVVGSVLDDETREGVPAAVVSLHTADGTMVGSATTDTAGGFVVRAGRAGEYLVRVAHPSYSPTESGALRLLRDVTLTVELRIGRAAIPLEPLIVTARSDQRLHAFYERARHRSGFGRYVMRDEIEIRRGARASELVREVPRIELVPVTRCLGCTAYNLIYIRTSGVRCLANIYVDGMRVPQSEDFTIDELSIHPQTLEGVEVHSSIASIPAELSSGSTCGVVAYWSRPHEAGRRFSWRRLGTSVGVFVAFLTASLLAL